MKNSALSLANFANSLSASVMEQNATGWLLDCEIRQHSRATIAIRRIVLDKLHSFLQQRKYSECGVRELRQSDIPIWR